MKITGMRTWLVKGAKYNWTMVRLDTDAGVSGYGEGTNWPGSPMAEAACRHVGERITGLDAERIDYIWLKLYKDMNWMGQAGPLLSAISAVDIALWDIKGKALKAPVYQLLGGAYRPEITLYANYWFTHGGHTPEEYASQASAAVDAGFTALKLDPFNHVNYLLGDHLDPALGLTQEQKRRAIEVSVAVQQAVGTDVPLAIETHGMLNASTAVEMAHRLHDVGVNCMWYEEPAPPEVPEAILDIRRRIRQPVALGERLHSRFMFQNALKIRAADFIMPDITRCGGITEMRKIANLAEVYNVPVAPHNPNGPISTIASAHVMATVPNFFRLEFILHDAPWRDEVLVPHGLPIENGKFHLSDRPGLGFELNEAELERHPGVRTIEEGFYV